MSLPWFTRMWFSAICFTTLSGTLGFISFDKFAYFGDFIFSSKLQLWRLVSCFALAGKLNFGFIMLIIMIVQYRLLIVVLTMMIVPVVLRCWLICCGWRMMLLGARPYMRS